jgi:hypothetical protein
LGTLSAYLWQAKYIPPSTTASGHTPQTDRRSDWSSTGDRLPTIRGAGVCSHPVHDLRALQYREAHPARLVASLGAMGFAYNIFRCANRPDQRDMRDNCRCSTKNLYADHSHSIADICKSLGISRATLYRYLDAPADATDITQSAPTDDK